MACEHGQANLAKMLVQKSAEFNIDLNAKDVEGSTAFHSACLMEEKKIVKMMVHLAKSFKLDLNAKNNDGQTGYEVAKSEGNLEIINIFTTNKTKGTLVTERGPAGR